MKNKRESARHKIMQFLSVTDDSGNEVIGNVLDISRSGMRVISELNSYPVGDNKNILIEILLDDGETQTYTITSQAIWIKMDAEPGYCQIGFRFLNLPDGSEEFLQFIIDND
jgi:c-di-GMP-binding flagellar brake protein YcgR